MPTIVESFSQVTTEGIEVTVQSRYVANHSDPSANRYVFAYTVDIKNVSSSTVQLRNRHWVITNGRGEIEEVRGPGVVGEMPRLGTGQSFSYTSGCPLNTSVGTMHGEYEMHRDDGKVFLAHIAPFSLSAPRANTQTAN